VRKRDVDLLFDSTCGPTGSCWTPRPRSRLEGAGHTPPEIEFLYCADSLGPPVEL
jgi:hypothetical protein